MTGKAFDQSLREVVMAHAEKPIVKCGDIVTTNVGGFWKRSHEVEIYRVDAVIVSLTGERARLDGESISEYSSLVPFMGVENHYFGRRLTKEGKPTGYRYGFLLPDFETKDGHQYRKKHNDFNHCGLSFLVDGTEDET